ncbi:MAG: SDR family oxidoreductase [Candidatus Nomurabacteria bacterium]|jgi:NAD(P)-dependent dehydrogenase (short-subunit alcohol dehydrogenase family)|nr:SDR family oxidoreductase [Candidatus Nomurabacteria bacterium]
MNKTILITGASDGLGFATAGKLLAKGYRVIGLSRSKPRDDRIDYIELDLTDENSIKNAVQQILTLPDEIDILVNCAGVMAREDDLSREELDRVFWSNALGVILLESLLLPKIKEIGADVINVISTTALRGDTRQPIYGASKWALRGFTKSLQEQFKGANARAVNFVSGGFVSRMPEKIGKTIDDPENWLPVDIVADELVKVIETPKRAEISEIIVNRK